MREPFIAVVACALSAIIFFAWGHFVGANDARTQIELKLEAARHACGSSTAWLPVDDLDLDPLCYGGSNRAKGRHP
jgi:hypothetical protein